MKVSLCGPHSFDTSTLPLTVVEFVLNGLASPPLSRMNSYLLHQVGSCELFCALTLGAGVEIPRLNATNPKATKIDRCTLFFIKLSFVGLRKQLRPSEPCLRGLGFYLNLHDHKSQSAQDLLFRYCGYPSGPVVLIVPCISARNRVETWVDSGSG